MPIIRAADPPRPDFWRVFGHSWWQYQTGPSGDQTGRVDAIFAGALDVEKSNWKNFAVNGAKAVGSGRSSGGWARVLSGIQPPTTSAGNRRPAPYAPDGGGTILGYGINDLGVENGSGANVRETYVDAMRALVSRCRASSALLVTDSVFTYSASGFATTAAGLDLGQAPTDRSINSTANTPTITFTIPADYTGEPIVFSFLKQPSASGVGGGTLTFSGTAGVTGTFNTQNVQGGLTNAINSYTCKRITNAGTNNAGAQLSAANAGQTIIMTLTAVGSAPGTVFFDGGWLEALTAPPVIVCNIARLPSAATYTSLYPNWTGTESSKDGDVLTTNTAVEAMVGEFDSMVQIADAYTALGKDATLTNDGVHPNEKGAAAIVDSFTAAIKRLRPSPRAWGETMSYNPPQPRAGYSRTGRRVSHWHGFDDVTPTYSTYTPVLGDFFAVPFEITEARDIWSQIGTEVATAGTTTTSIRWGIYDDIDRVGYPQQLTPYDPTGSAIFALTNSAGLKAQNLLFPWPPDPGLYWLAMKIDAVGTGQVLRSYSGTSRFISQRGTTGVASAIAGCCLKLTGQATGALPGTFPTGAVAGGGGATTASAPVIQIFKAK